MQTHIRSTTDSTQHGDLPRTENDGSNSWKWLRSSLGLARDDDDDELLAHSFVLSLNLHVKENSTYKSCLKTVYNTAVSRTERHTNITAADKMQIRSAADALFLCCSCIGIGTCRS